MGSALYNEMIRWSSEKLDARGHELTLKCWEARPWMVNAYTGSTGDDRERQMMEWCRDHFGPEAWPIHGKPGAWYRGGATVFGWTHMGFETREMMEAFEAAWPAPAEVAAA